MNKRLKTHIEKSRKLYNELAELGLKGEFDEKSGEITYKGSDLVGLKLPERRVKEWLI